MKMRIKNDLSKILSLALLFLFSFILYACQQVDVEVIETPMPTPTPTLPPDQEAIWEKWEGSEHADTYIEGNGDNTYCARCHSPNNWNYSATVASNELILEEDWSNIGCDSCHQMDGRIAGEQYYWHDTITVYYEVVSSTTALCQECHLIGGEVPHSHLEMGDEVHQDFTCTDCHDAHDPYASCGDCHSDILEARSMPAQQHVNLSDQAQCLACHPIGMDAHSMETQRSGETDCLVCHANFANVSSDDLPPVYHTSTHIDVPCSVCHDASGLAVDLVEGLQIFATYRTYERSGSVVETEYKSHDLTTAVDCTRCHYKNNPWDLSESVLESDMTP